MPPKFRLFGGPNGSGKTFLFDRLRQTGIINTELYINADRILRDINERGSFNFNAYRVKSDEEEFKQQIINSGLFDKIDDPNFLEQFKLVSGVLRFDVDKITLNSYHASFIASYLAFKLFETGQSFCFETVMSHESKLTMLDLAKSKKYKTYLYFVFTDNPELNVARVKIRAAGGLHDVDPEKIRNRYDRTFELLPDAIAKADEGYIIDNSIIPTVVIEKRNRQIIKVSDLPLTEKVVKAIGHLV